MDNKKLASLLLLAGGAYLLYAGTTGDWNLCAVTAALGLSSWPENWLATGGCYVPTLNAIEQQYGLPQNLLCAIAYQESRFNPAAVNASSGALGMFQLMPQWYPSAGANWQADAQTAATALSGYYNTFGNWQDAIAAYDWGPTNLTSSGASQLSQLPIETQNYVTAIASAVPGVTGPFIA